MKEEEIIKKLRKDKDKIYNSIDDYFNRAIEANKKELNILEKWYNKDVEIKLSFRPNFRELFYIDIRKRYGNGYFFDNIRFYDTEIYLSQIQEKLDEINKKENCNHDFKDILFFNRDLNFPELLKKCKKCDEFILESKEIIEKDYILENIKLKEEIEKIKEKLSKISQDD